MKKPNAPEYKRCDRCPNQPGQLVRFFYDGHREALCFTCWEPLTWNGDIGTGECKVLHWINKDGKLS